MIGNVNLFVLLLDASANTPLHLAARCNIPDAAEILVKDRTCDFDLLNSDGLCAIHVAIENNFVAYGN